MTININQLKKRILARQEELIEKINQETEAKYEFSHEVSGELSNYDNHPADTGTELFEKEKDSALQRLAESELEEINNSLHAMEEGTYGICRVCGGNIDPERLEALPTADYCVEHAEKPAYHGDTSPKEVFKGRDDGGENSWEDVRQYGTSSSSIEYAGNIIDFGDEEEKEMDVEDFLAADIEGNFTHAMPNHKAYEERLDDEE